MDENDDEILYENSDLSKYLREMGYSDVETIKTDNSIFNVGFHTDVNRNIGVIDSDTVQDINVLMSSKLMFEEDVAYMENVLSSFTTVKTGVLRSMFKGKSAAAVVFLGLCFYFLIGGYVFIFVSTFYAYRTTDYLWKKHFTQKKLKQFVLAIQTNYVLLKRALKFLHESNQILEVCNIDDKYDKLQYFSNFKTDFIKSERKMVQLLSKATGKLIKSFPMHNTIENVPHYLCNSFQYDFVCSLDQSKLHQLYSLIQSEFLQRVILTMIPNFQLSDLNEYAFHKILREVTFDSKKIAIELNKNFKFVYLNGIYQSNVIKQVKNVPKKNTNVNWSLTTEIASNVHDTSNKLQSLLIRAREIENCCSQNEMNIEKDLIELQKDLSYCQNNITESLMFIKKLDGTHSKSENEFVKDESVVSNVASNPLPSYIVVGYTDLDPNVDDEIFEAEIKEDDAGRKKSNTDDFNLEDILKRKQEKEYSKKVLKELKTKLVDKAKNWKERENKIMEKKFGIKFDEPEQESALLLPTPGDNWPLPHLRRCLVPRKNGRIIQYHAPQHDSTEDQTDDKTFHLERLNNNMFAMKNMFLKPQVAMSEDVFCGSGENSEEEEAGNEMES